MRDITRGTHVVVKASKTAQTYSTMGDAEYKIAWTVAQGNVYEMEDTAARYGKLDTANVYFALPVQDWNNLDSGNGNAFLGADDAWPNA